MSHLIGYNLGALHQASQELNRKIDSSYYMSAPTVDQNPIIPNPSTFDDLDDLHRNDLPTPAQCAVHLELLEVFHALRIRVLDSKSLDKAFGLGTATKKVYRRRYVKALKKWVNEGITLRDLEWEKNQDKKWTFYLGEAVQRFRVWAEEYDASLADDGQGEILMTDHSSLPPVDILMVWHAFLLNPADFLEYCQSFSLKHLPRVNFPWKLIHEAISSQGPIRDTWEYHSNNWKGKKGDGVYWDVLLDSIIKRGQTTTLSIKKVFRPAIVGKLVDNVERQRVFVDKMNEHLWIRSPALQGTMQRAVERYENYLELFKLYPGKMLVPTLDIDLVWHTSQLSPAAYKTSVEVRSGRFINHDDKIGKSKLAVGNDETQILYRTRFGLEYSVCLCWECQTITSAVEDSDKDDYLVESRGDSFADDLTRQVMADIEYHRAVESARRRNHVKLPIRDKHLQTA
ncbi:hypothetical protein NW752_007153 [Fusarium irregulare]|uniref:Uncharacterized protein n=1 Tax=Fusarium irregulare TaxID=2494466 RepID=A0A9W8PLU5_9HYPO|nr:hypothetical protein NW766_007953 [Fusarium irregulare]KAJ4014393.1 hypothetical protein NW752_007153 [Fusarium irregulare]